MTALRDDWLAAFARAFAHVPLWLYDEDLEPAEVALGQVAAEVEALEAENAGMREALREIVKRPHRLDEWQYQMARDALAALGEKSSPR